jgi:hypothetical protein
VGAGHGGLALEERPVIAEQRDQIQAILCHVRQPGTCPDLLDATGIHEPCGGQHFGGQQKELAKLPGLGPQCRYMALLAGHGDDAAVGVEHRIRQRRKLLQGGEVQRGELLL